MLSFDLSIIDLVLAIAVAILLILHLSTNQTTKKESLTKKSKTAFLPDQRKLYFSRLMPNLPSLILIALGSITLVWVGWLIWYDATTWGHIKSFALIFFSSRTGEAIGLGIGMKIFDYFLLGLALSLSGLFIFLRRRILFARV